MTLEDRKKIISEDYGSIIADINRMDSRYDRFNNDLKIKLDDKYEVVYFLVPQTILLEGVNVYTAIPKIYGLLNKDDLTTLGVDRVQDNTFLGLRGEGVLLGFLDTGIDYQNKIFQYADNTTRIVSIWDQTIESQESGEETFFYGTEYVRDEINEALKSETPYDIVPSRDENGHGTMIAGIAGGGINEENEFQGVVPSAEFVVVKLKRAKKVLQRFYFIDEDVECYQEDDIMFAIKYLQSVARRLGKPIVICIAIGTTQGAHDGHGTLSDFIAYTGSYSGTAMIVAAGNEGNSKKHFYGTIASNSGSDMVELNVGKNEPGFSMELWGYAPATYSIDILSPTGEYIPRIIIRMGESRIIPFLFEDTTVYVDSLIIEARTGDPLILMRFQTPAEGIWKFRVYGRGATNLRFHIWLPLSSFVSSDTYFINSNPDTTITSPGNTARAITVTAANSSYNEIYTQASRGYTKSGGIKPDITAPGVDVLVPVLDNQFITASGTSIAAAYVTGIAAMIMEWGIVKGNYSAISSIQMQRFLIRGVVTNPGTIYPNNVWGYGGANIYNTFMSLSGRLDEQLR